MPVIAPKPRITREIEGLREAFTAPDVRETTLPEGSQARKDIPMASGVLDYFPAAIAYIAKISKAGNDKHNPGQPLHWARGKSMDHADCIVRHLTERGTVDGEDNLRHSGKMAWRALALLQEELEAQDGAPLPRGARPAYPQSGPAAPSEVLVMRTDDGDRPLAWNEGWVCECGSTQVSHLYTEEGVKEYVKRGTWRPACNSVTCSSLMQRVAR